MEVQSHFWPHAQIRHQRLGERYDISRIKGDKSYDLKQHATLCCYHLRHDQDLWVVRTNVCHADQPTVALFKMFKNKYQVKRFSFIVFSGHWENFGWDMNANKGGVFWQGGSVFELFSGRGNNPVAHWKLCGGPAAIRRVSFLTSDFSLFSASLLSFGIDTFPSEQQRTSKGPTGHCRRIMCLHFMKEKPNSTMLKMNQKMECCSWLT